MHCNWTIVSHTDKYELFCNNCKTTRIRDTPNLIRDCRPDVKKVAVVRNTDIDPPTVSEVIHAEHKHVALVPLPPKQYKQRLDEEKDVIRDLCGGCEHFKNNRCEFSTCGCSENYDQRYANILNIVGANCPAKKWGQETINDELEPSFLEKAKSAASAVISHVETGLTKVSTEVQKERLAKCGPCRFRKGANCQKCGCILSLKTEMSSQSCPIGEWGQETEEGRLRSG